MTYTYDTNPIHSGFSQNSYGRLTTTQYYVENASTNGFGCGEYGLYDTYTEMYSYQAAGAVTAKNLGLARIVGYGRVAAPRRQMGASRWTTRRTQWGGLRR